MAPSQRSLMSEFHLFFVLLARQTPSHGNRSGVGTYRRRPTRETRTQNLMVYVCVCVTPRSPTGLPQPTSNPGSATADLSPLTM